MENTINDVYEVFKDYYGEERVDLQNNTILVYFPSVTVTNEHDESTVVTDLYVKTVLDTDGTIVGSFTMARGSYPLSQVYSNYLHSHAYSIPKTNDDFTRCCLGTGPIKGTIALLSQDCDLDRWALYCYELDKYTQVESIQGRPYHYITNISKSNLKQKELPLGYSVSPIVKNPGVIQEFLPYLLEKQNLNFTEEHNHYFIAHPFREYISILTTDFVDFINTRTTESVESYINSGFLVKGTYDRGTGSFTIKVPASASFDGVNPGGLRACVFKGEDVIVSVINDIIERDDSRDLIINPGIANYILYKILTVLNYGNIRKQEGNTTEEVGTVVL